MQPLFCVKIATAVGSGANLPKEKTAKFKRISQSI